MSDTEPTDDATSATRVDVAAPTHTPAGKFARGNRLGRGNPLAARAAKLRAVLLKALTPADTKAIADVLIAMAKQGDLGAIRELFDRTIGKAAQTEILERVERLEQAAGEKGKV